MPPPPAASVSRRDLVASLAGGWVASHWPAIARAAEHAEAMAGSVAPYDKLAVLAPLQAADVEALAEDIIPRTTTAGAREAGVIHFIDRALETFFAQRAAAFAAGLAEFEDSVAARHPGERYASLPEAGRLELLGSAARTPFFSTMRTLSILGFLALPSYGGNRDQIGWRAVGFDDRHAFQPPFGYYDRDYPGFVTGVPDAERKS